MKRTILIKLSLILFASPLFATNYDNGITTYKKLCKKCHGSAYYGSQILSQDDWEEHFENNSELLLNKHLKNELAMKKFNSSYYKNRKQKLHEFLYDHAKDTGAVAPCTSNSCGIYK